MGIRGTTKIYGVLGQNIGYSLSPIIHNAALNAAKLDAVYLAFSLQELDAAKILSSLTTLQIQGANVTIPYKTSLFRQLDSIDPFAKKVEAVNTLVYQDGAWQGYNTDGIGFLQGLKELFPQQMPSSVHIFGAGGAAKAISHALLDQGLANLSLANRSPESLNQLYQLLRKNYPDRKITLEPPQKGDLLVQTTPLGNDGKTLSLAEKHVAGALGVIDIIYAPTATPLLKLAQSYQLPTQNGLSMLIGQALAAFRLWHKQEADKTAVLQALAPFVDQA